jgi:hypothetical protein
MLQVLFLDLGVVVWSRRVCCPPFLQKGAEVSI